VDVRFDDDVDAADAVEGYLLGLVGAPVAHARHVRAAGVVFLVAWAEKERLSLVDFEGGGSNSRFTFG